MLAIFFERIGVEDDEIAVSSRRDHPVLNPAMSAESRVAATIASDAVIPIATRLSAIEVVEVADRNGSGPCRSR